MAISRLVRTLFAMSMLGASLSGVAQDAQKRAIQSEYDKLSRALQRENVDVVVAMMSPNFKLTRPNGQIMTRKDIETNYRQQFQMIKSWPKVSMRVRSLTVTGNRAEVGVVSNVVAIVPVPQMNEKKEPILKDGKMLMRDGRLEVYVESRDVWVLTNGKWIAESSKVLKETTKMDGKPVPNQN